MAYDAFDLWCIRTTLVPTRCDGVTWYHDTMVQPHAHTKNTADQPSAVPPAPPGFASPLSLRSHPRTNGFQASMCLRESAQTQPLELDSSNDRFLIRFWLQHFDAAKSVAISARLVAWAWVSRAKHSLSVIKA